MKKKKSPFLVHVLGEKYRIVELDDKSYDKDMNKRLKEIGEFKLDKNQTEEYKRQNREEVLDIISFAFIIIVCIATVTLSFRLSLGFGIYMTIFVLLLIITSIKRNSA